MESGKILNNTDAVPIKGINFSILKDLLTAHFDMLSQHYRYFVKIKASMSANSGISVEDADISAYLSDVMRLTVIDVAEFKTLILPTLMTSLLGRVAYFKRLIEIAQRCHEDVAISTIHLAIQADLVRAEEGFKNLKHHKVINAAENMPTILRETEFLKNILELLNPLLPVPHKKLAEIIFFVKEINGFNCRWDAQRSEHAKQTIRFNSMVNVLQTKVVNEDVAFISAEIKKFIDTNEEMIRLNKKIDGLIVNSKVEIAGEAEFLTMILANVINFYEVNGLLEKLHRIELTVDTHLKLVELYERRRATILLKVKFCREKRELLLKSIKKIQRTHHNAEFNAALDGLLNQLTVVDRLSNSWPPLMPSPLKDSILQEKHFDDFKAIIKQVSSIIKQATEILLAAFTASISEKQTTSVTSQESERELFLREQEKINTEYRQAVKQRRLQKKQAKIEERKVVTSPAAPEKPIVIFKNLDVEERLLGMNAHYFQLLQDIFAGSKNIFYSDIYNLITNQLGGEIEEFGSSHKRIRIASYFLQIISHSPQTTEPPTESSVTTGGFFRPHGTAHQPGAMSRFNLELVADTLRKAGITPEALAELAERRKVARKY